jgi:hypothetical protein
VCVCSVERDSVCIAWSGGGYRMYTHTHTPHIHQLLYITHTHIHTHTHTHTHLVVFDVQGFEPLLLQIHSRFSQQAPHEALLELLLGLWAWLVG